MPSMTNGFCKEQPIFTGMQSNKSIKFFIKYFLGPILFLWLSVSIYNQILKQPRLEQSWIAIQDSLVSGKIIFLIAAILLIPVNWGIEAYKWQLVVRPIRRIGFWQSFRAVLSGVSFSVTMPNRIGEYVGRMMYMPEGSRLKTISAAVVGSVAQLIITLAAGLVALSILKADLLKHYPAFLIWYQFAFYVLVGFLAATIIMYFQVDRAVRFARRWPALQRYFYLVESLSNFNGRFLIRLLFISFLRYGIFLLQYVLVFTLFGLDVPVGIMIGTTCVLFLAMAVIPSIALVEVGLRGEVSLKLMAMFTTNILAVSLATVAIWFFNLIVPAIIGSLLLLNLKSGRKHETS